MTIMHDELHPDELEEEEILPSELGPVEQFILPTLSLGQTNSAAHQGVAFTAITSTTVNPVFRLLGRDYDRVDAEIIAVDQPVIIAVTKENAQAGASVATPVAGSNPTPSQPAVPATGVAQQNTNLYPVTVVISANGATITNVSVNGVTVGTAAGTYTVPSAGAISIAYSVATPTWIWSDANPVPAATVAIATGPYVLIPAGTRLPVMNCSEIWCAATSTTLGRVSVLVNRILHV